MVLISMYFLTRIYFLISIYLDVHRVSLFTSTGNMGRRFAAVLLLAAMLLCDVISGQHAHFSTGWTPGYGTGKRSSAGDCSVRMSYLHKMLSLLSVSEFIITRDPFYLHGLTLIPAWIHSYIHYKVWYGFAYPFPNFNGATFGVWEMNE